MISATPKILFLSDERYIHSPIPGGVQICTAEYINYLKATGFEVSVLPVQPRVSTLARLKVRLGIEVYDLYTIKHHYQEIADIIRSQNINFVCFNQLNLAYAAADLRLMVNDNVRFVGLSHGNESGDYLHEISKHRKSPWLKTWRLGRMLTKEQHLFSRVLDAVITISEMDTNVNKWLGADKILSLPRILHPNFLSWKPVAQHIGFVGTLNHKPNFDGINSVAKELDKPGFDGTLVIVGAPEQIGKQLQDKYSFISYLGPLTVDQLEQEAATWSLYINPVLWYARGASTKLAQAINWGLPVLTTPAGARGYELSAGDIVTVDNTAKSFASAVHAAIQSQEQVNALRNAAISNAKGFDQQVWVRKLKDFITSLL